MCVVFTAFEWMDQANTRLVPAIPINRCKLGQGQLLHGLETAAQSNQAAWSWTDWMKPQARTPSIGMRDSIRFACGQQLPFQHS